MSLDPASLDPTALNVQQQALEAVPLTVEDIADLTRVWDDGSRLRVQRCLTGDEQDAREVEAFNLRATRNRILDVHGFVPDTDATEWTDTGPTLRARRKAPGDNKPYVAPDFVRTVRPSI